MTKEQLDYVQCQAEKNMDFHLKNLEGLNGEAYKMLTLLFAVIAASFASTLKAYQAGHSWILIFSIAALCVYLMGIALLLLGSVKPSELQPPSNEPRNLLPSIQDPNYTLEEVREAEILNLQERISTNRLRCEKTGKIMRIAQYAFLVSPMVFLVAAVIAVVLQSILDS